MITVYIDVNNNKIEVIGQQKQRWKHIMKVKKESNTKEKVLLKMGFDWMQMKQLKHILNSMAENLKKHKSWRNGK